MLLLCKLMLLQYAVLCLGLIVSESCSLRPLSTQAEGPDAVTGAVTSLDANLRKGADELLAKLASNRVSPRGAAGSKPTSAAASAAVSAASTPKVSYRSLLIERFTYLVLANHPERCFCLPPCQFYPTSDWINLLSKAGAGVARTLNDLYTPGKAGGGKAAAGKAAPAPAANADEPGLVLGGDKKDERARRVSRIQASSSSPWFQCSLQCPSLQSTVCVLVESYAIAGSHTRACCHESLACVLHPGALAQFRSKTGKFEAATPEELESLERDLGATASDAFR